MPFQRSCLYHPYEPMRVIEEDQEEEYKRLLENGWFDHPTKAKEAKIKNELGEDNERPIRRNTQQRQRDGKQSTKETRSGT